MIDKEDEYIVEAAIKGINDDNKLKCIIMEHNNCNDVIAGLLLAKFLINNQEFIKDDIDDYKITY